MSTVEDAISYVFVWHALSDACPKCRSLNGREYEEDRVYHEVVWDGGWGNIWDLNANHSLAHPNCRCQLEMRVTFDWNKIRELKMLQETLHRFDCEVELPQGEVSAMSAEINAMRTAVSNLREEVATSLPRIREMNSLLTTYLALGRRLGAEDLTELVSKFQAARVSAEMLYRSIQMIYVTGGPIGWLIGLGGIALGGIMLADSMSLRRPQY